MYINRNRNTHKHVTHSTRVGHTGCLTSDLQYSPGEAGPLGLQPEEVLYPKQLPLLVVGPLHCIKVPPGTLLTHHRRLQLLQSHRQGWRENIRWLVSPSKYQYQMGRSISASHCFELVSVVKNISDKHSCNSIFVEI